jgi:hypothetical protein
MQIGLEIQATDALKINADVLVLKYAQELFGTDSLAFTRLALVHQGLETRLPKPNSFLFLESLDSLGAKQVLFSGVPGIFQFRYKEIRGFAFKSLNYLAEQRPDTEHICFTLHGVNYGLDEAEAFESEVAGIVDAIMQGKFPASLKRITIVEFYEPRAERLKSILKGILPDGMIKVEDRATFARRNLKTSQLINDAGIHSEEKPLIFVAMPFDKKLDDVFHYGVQNAVNRAGFLCERADKIAFTGDILELIKRRIGKASLVIADLTTTNPNVYLEVGYAWGIGKSTVLIAQDADDLKFDVKGQKCIIYSGIRELEEKLSEELMGLKKK